MHQLARCWRHRLILLSIHLLGAGQAGGATGRWWSGKATAQMPVAERWVATSPGVTLQQFRHPTTGRVRWLWRGQFGDSLFEPLSQRNDGTLSWSNGLGFRVLSPALARPARTDSSACRPCQPADLRRHLEASRKAGTTFGNLPPWTESLKAAHDVLAEAFLRGLDYPRDDLERWSGQFLRRYRLLEGLARRGALLEVVGDFATTRIDGARISLRPDAESDEQRITVLDRFFARGDRAQFMAQEGSWLTAAFLEHSVDGVSSGIKGPMPEDSFPLSLQERLPDLAAQMDALSAEYRPLRQTLHRWLEAGNELKYKTRGVGSLWLATGFDEAHEAALSAYLFFKDPDYAWQQALSQTFPMAATMVADALLRAAQRQILGPQEIRNAADLVAWLRRPWFRGMILSATGDVESVWGRRAEVGDPFPADCWTLGRDSHGLSVRLSDSEVQRQNHQRRATRAASTDLAQWRMHSTMTSSGCPIRNAKAGQVTLPPEHQLIGEELLETMFDYFLQRPI